MFRGHRKRARRNRQRRAHMVTLPLAVVSVLVLLEPPLGTCTTCGLLLPLPITLFWNCCMLACTCFVVYTVGGGGDGLGIVSVRVHAATPLHCL